MKLTKSAMLDYIEKSGMIINFDRNYLMRHTRAYITELYARASAYACELSAWERVINKLLKHAERKADKIGFDIDNDHNWIAIHTILVEWDMGERTLTAEDKQTIASNLEFIYKAMGMELWSVALPYIEEAWEV